MPSQRARELLEVVVIGRDDLVAVVSQEHHGSVDHVGAPCGRKELADGMSKWFVEGSQVDAGEGLGEASLTGAATPNLAEDACVGDGKLAFCLGTLETNPHRPLVSFERDECAAVEHERHADFALLPPERRPPRTTVAS